MDLTNELANIVVVIFTKFWVHKMFLAYVVRVANYRKFVIDVHTQICYTIKQFTDEIIPFTRNIINCNTEEQSGSQPDLDM